MALEFIIENPPLYFRDVAFFFVTRAKPPLFSSVPFSSSCGRLRFAGVTWRVVPCGYFN